MPHGERCVGCAVVPPWSAPSGNKRNSFHCNYIMQTSISGQKDDEYFRDGITEDITTEISKILEFRVFSRSAVLAYRDKPVTPSHVGQQLNATHIVEGSTCREADRLRITPS